MFFYTEKVKNSKNIVKNSIMTFFALFLLKKRSISIVSFIAFFVIFIILLYICKN